jgi:hypothetical protein
LSGAGEGEAVSKEVGEEERGARGGVDTRSDNATSVDVEIDLFLVAWQGSRNVSMILDAMHLAKERAVADAHAYRYSKPNTTTGRLVLVAFLMNLPAHVPLSPPLPPLSPLSPPRPFLYTSVSIG